MTLKLGLAVILTAWAAAPVAPAVPPVVDGPSGEAWFTVHPDGQLIVFGRNDDNWRNHRLYMSRLIGGRWTEAELLPFSVDVDARTAHFAPDGRSMLFISWRSPAGEERPPGQREQNIWRVSWDGRNWGSPQILPPPINTTANEIDAVEVDGGVIYFSSMRPGGMSEKPDLYRAVPTTDGYRIEPLAAFNTSNTESTLYVTPDERLIVFHRGDDPRGLGKDDLFAARRVGDDWGPEIHLKGNANSPEYEYGPEVSPDGRTLYFTTHRSGKAAVMAVSLDEVLSPNGERGAP